MDNELVTIFVAIIVALAVVFGAVLVSQQLRNNCINSIKDKQAIEIQLVCRS